MTDNLTPAAPAQFYGFARTRTFPEYVATLNPPGGDTASSGATIVDIPAEGEVQAQQSEPSTESEASQELGGSAPNSIVLASPDADDFGPTIDLASAPATIEVASPPSNSRSTNSRAREKSRSRNKTSPKHRKKTAPPPPEPPRPMTALARHQANCGICRTEFREEIDDAFINWESVNDIAREFHIERRVVYRHAHATGLFPKRDRNIRRALGLIIHRADKVQGVTADSVIRAVQLLAHINESGDWIAPPTHVIFSSGTHRPANNDAPPADNLIDTRCQAPKKLNP